MIEQSESQQCEKEKSLLIIKCQGNLSDEEIQEFKANLRTSAERLNAEVILSVGDDLEVDFYPAGLGALVDAVKAQTESITRLANSNAMIAQALAEQIDDEGADEAIAYLDGSPAR